MADVDDPRTTDNAWIETTAFHFHCPPEIGDKMALAGGDRGGHLLAIFLYTCA